MSIGGIACIRVPALRALHTPAELGRVLTTAGCAGGITFCIIGTIAFLTRDGITNITMPMTLTWPALSMQILTAAEIAQEATVAPIACSVIGTPQAGRVVCGSLGQNAF